MDFINCDKWCICLQERNDRYEASQIEFKKVGLDNTIKYHRPVRDSRGGRIGCWLSHLYCMETSYRNNPNQSYILIFEDDVRFCDNWKQQIPLVQKFLENEPEWDFFRLGCRYDILYRESKTSPNIWMGQSTALHAYFINMKYVEKLLNQESFYHPENTEHHIDTYVHDDPNLRDYFLLDAMCDQNMDLGTDNNWGKGFFISFQDILYSNKFIYDNWEKYRSRIHSNAKYLPFVIQENILKIFVFLVILLIVFIIYLIYITFKNNNQYII